MRESFREGENRRLIFGSSIFRFLTKKVGNYKLGRPVIRAPCLLSCITWVEILNFNLAASRILPAFCFMNRDK